MSSPLGEPGTNTESGREGDPIQDGRDKAPPKLLTAMLLADKARPPNAIRYWAHRCPKLGCGPNVYLNVYWCLTCISTTYKVQYLALVCQPMMVGVPVGHD
ncbi:hypothetical protein NDU88_007078 [Pleurodeles waltl]|uniref:Uncharacterized protein n=1 Tax=Pleurodeles waltl TaxID=8319 RepID=A0AAV7N133_PLEWA|nr:hypothetical protein NDU88_007078 [Pleurodeles waltl]